jgi:hypothetical protein
VAYIKFCSEYFVWIISRFIDKFSGDILHSLHYSIILAISAPYIVGTGTLSAEDKGRQSVKLVIHPYILRVSILQVQHRVLT